MGRLFYLKKNNKGSTLIIVLVVVTFIAILGTTSIAAAMFNYKMKIIDKESKKAFYTAEEAVDQIYSGLGMVSMTKLSEAYSEELSSITRVTTDGSSNVSYQIDNNTCNQEMRVLYTKKMLSELFSTYNSWNGENAEDGTVNTIYELGEYNLFKDKLNSYIEDNSKISVKSVGTKTITTTKKNGINNYVIKAKNCVIEYLASEDGYFANVTIDIEIALPDGIINFTDDSSTELTTFADYSFVGLRGVVVNDAKTLTLNNSKIFAGDNDKNRPGFIIGSAAGADINNSTLVSAGLVSVGYSGNAAPSSNNSKLDVDVNSRVWCENLETAINSNNSTINISGSAFVKDDLNVDGNNNKAVISGNYVGYMAQGPNGLKNHTYSSAMLLNGKNSTLDFSQVTSLIIGGKAYIDMGENKYMTGESVALRGNQEIYLLPDAFLRSKADDTKYYSNPMATGYTSDLRILIPDNFFAKKYLDETKPVVEYTIDSKLVYYYLNIKEEYIDDYLNDIINGSSSDSYIVALRNVIKQDITELKQTSIIASDLSKVYANAALISAGFNNDNLTGVSSVGATSASVEFSKTSKDLVNRYKFLTNLLYEPAFYTDGTNSNGNTAVFDNGSKVRNYYIDDTLNYVVINGKRINVSNLTGNAYSNFINESYLSENTKTGPLMLTGKSLAGGKSFKMYFISEADNSICVGTTHSSDDATTKKIKYYLDITDGIIVAKGDVYVRQDFNGVIITSGTIYVDNTITVTNTYNGIEDMLSNLSDTDKEQAKKFFKAWNKNESSSTEGDSGKSEVESVAGITYKDIVNFSNWKKSEVTAGETTTNAKEGK